MHGATALVANAVQLFDGANGGGFVLGTDVKANSLKVNYHFAAFKAVAGKVAVGTYEGSNSSQSITGLGFAPALVIMMSEHSEEMVFRTSASSATCNFHDNHWDRQARQREQQTLFLCRVESDHQPWQGTLRVARPDRLVRVVGSGAALETAG
jgi:hypothetical protein